MSTPASRLTADVLASGGPVRAVDVADVLPAPPGIALTTRPGHPMLRVRVPLLTYATFAAHVRSHP